MKVDKAVLADSGRLLHMPLAGVEKVDHGFAVALVLQVFGQLYAAAQAGEALHATPRQWWRQAHWSA